MQGQFYGCCILLLIISQTVADNGSPLSQRLLTLHHRPCQMVFAVGLIPGVGGMKAVIRQYQNIGANHAVGLIDAVTLCIIQTLAPYTRIGRSVTKQQIVNTTVVELHGWLILCGTVLLCVVVGTLTHTDLALHQLLQSLASLALYITPIEVFAFVNNQFFSHIGERLYYLGAKIQIIF